MHIIKQDSDLNSFLPFFTWFDYHLNEPILVERNENHQIS